MHRLTVLESDLMVQIECARGDTDHSHVSYCPSQTRLIVLYYLQRIVKKLTVSDESKT